MAKSRDNYLGRCKTLTSAYGPLRKISLGPDDLKKINEFAAENKGWTNILFKMKKTFEPGESDFYVEMDLWKPDPSVTKEKLPF
jgi:hypothetical protein